MARREIEIQRNIIEKSLMFLKDSFRKNRKAFLYSLGGALLAILFIIIGFLYYDMKATRDLVAFERALDEYQEITDDAERKERVLKTVAELDKLVASSHWGFVDEYGSYIIGNLLYTENMFQEAKKYYLQFVDESPSSFFAPLALQQAARSAEMLGTVDEALTLYQQLESEYGDSQFADHIYYNLGRIYGRRGDIFKAREYYNRVIISFPQSLFSEKAKKNLFLLGATDTVQKGRD